MQIDVELLSYLRDEAFDKGFKEGYKAGIEKGRQLAAEGVAKVKSVE